MIDNCLGGVMVSLRFAVDLGFDPRAGKTKDYTVGIYFYSDWHE
jgi:hypothetical protein